MYMYMHRHAQNVSNTDVSIVHGYVDVVKATANEKAGIAFFRSREGKNNFFLCIFLPVYFEIKVGIRPDFSISHRSFPSRYKTNKASH